MLTILNLDNSNVVATRASGWLTHDDYGVLLPLLEKKLNGHRKISWYFEMDEHFKGWTPAAVWDDLKWDLRHANDLEKIAMVGTNTLEKALTLLMKPFTSAEVRYFELEERDEALKWIVEM